MFATEKELERFIEEELLKITKKIHLQPVETHVRTGTHDTNWCVDGKEFWLELKIGTVVNGRVNAKIRPSQISWLAKRKKCGGRAFIVVGVTGKKTSLFIIDNYAKIEPTGFNKKDAVEVEYTKYDKNFRDDFARTLYFIFRR